MRGTGWFSDVSRLAGEHPLLATWLSLFVGVAVILGVSHECRLFGDFVIVAIRYGKHELLGWRDFFRRLKKELTTWDSES